MNWQELWNDILTLEPGMLEIALRLACAMLIGLVIGTEREYTHRPAGMRTHILVALGACVVSVTGGILFSQYNTLGATPDPARLSAQVITCVGFLGAGTIMKEGVNVKGLTTAASVWAVACLGIASGFGYYALALLGTVFIFITLTVVEGLQHRFIHVYSAEASYELETTDIAATLTHLHEATQKLRITVSDLCAEQGSDTHRITFRVRFPDRRSKKYRIRFFDSIISAPETRALRHADAKADTTV